MKGKNKCKILKEIRQRIADENDIPYVTRECSYQGACTGTCPKCEAELRYLEQELEKRRGLGKTVAVAAVATGLSLSLVGCVPGNGSDGSGVNTPTLPTPKPPVVTSCPESMEPLAGEAAVNETQTEELEGDIAIVEETAPSELNDTREDSELAGMYLPSPEDTVPAEPGETR